VSGALEARAVALLQQLIRLDTVNPPGRETSAQEPLAAELRAAGFEVRPAPMPESGHTIQIPVILCTREV
jgi:acetylornithine deacetylase/succinyl-diaminopimelate desuccinylase-like protein